MHNVIKILEKITDRYAPSRMISFDIAHVFKALQLMEKHGRVSRGLLIDELNLGEGSIKTLVKHLKMQELIETSKAGMWLTEKGKKIYSKILDSIPKEMDIPSCSLGLGKYNHVVLLKGLEPEIGSGVEQRDSAIRMGAVGATTLLYKDGKLLMPGLNQDSLRRDPTIRRMILEKLRPENEDVIIIGSAEKKKTAEFATKKTALLTVSDHHRHF